MVDPAGPELVADCLRRDYRWDWQVDEREVYLARLVRDLRLPVAGVTARLFTASREGSGDGHRFELTVGVVEALGRAGVDEAVEEIRRCVREGERWLDVLQTVAASWPATWWEDLLPAVLGRLDAAAEPDVLWLSAPWPRWALHDRRIAKAVEAANSRPKPSRPFADTPTDALLAILRRPAGADDRRLVLWELRRRPPQPELLDLVDELVGAGLESPLAPAIIDLGILALPMARRWVAVPGHPLAWTGWRVLAAHGDATDVSALLAGWDWLDTRPDDRCGYDELAAGLARIGGPAAVSALPRIRHLWYSPHSYERPRYLRSLITLDQPGVERLLTEGLWDCEADVRLLAAQHTPLNEMTRQRLRYLRDDPIETNQVRATAADRLT